MAAALELCCWIVKFGEGNETNWTRFLSFETERIKLYEGGNELVHGEQKWSTNRDRREARLCHTGHQSAPQM